LSPDSGVAGVGPGVLLPGVDSELARPRDGVEDPEPLAGADVESAHVALDVFLAVRRAAGKMRGPDDHHVLRDGRRRVQADFAGDQVDLLIVVELEIDDAAFAEARNERAGLCVERDQPVAGRYVEDSLVTTVGPVGQAATGKLPGRRLGALALDLAVHPKQLA